MRVCKVLLLAALLMTSSMEFVKGTVEISPSELAPVCHAGDQLKLACSTSGVLQTWKFTAISESGVAMTFTRSVSSSGSTGVDSQPLIINSTIMFTFSRLSCQGSLPLISRMTIDPVTEGLNGTRVNCLDGITSESATTTIHIIGDTQNPGLSIGSHSEQFTSDEVVVILEWIYSTSGSYDRQLATVQNVSVNVVPALRLNAVLVFVENTSVILMLQYNTVYNVSITQLGICGQLNHTAYIELNYSRCSNPTKLAHIYVTIEGYEDPALEGENITFICPPESMLSGPNSSTCMRNGEWEPHPKDVTCAGSLVATRGIPDPAIAMLRTALISVTFALVVLSVLMFLVGFITGGYYFSQRWRKAASAIESEPPSNPPNEPQEGVDLKKNIAYMDLDPA